MIKCIHNFIVTGWKISSHSHLAQEIMCRKCLCIIAGDEMSRLRLAKNECYKAVDDHIKFMNTLETPIPALTFTDNGEQVKN